MEHNNLLTSINAVTYNNFAWKFFRKALHKVYTKELSSYLRFSDPSFDTDVLEQNHVTLKIISPEDIDLLSEKKYYKKKIWDERWSQGAELLAAIWNGQIIEYTWFSSKEYFYDSYNHFDIKLSPGEFYVFDYRALERKPHDLRHYRLMKAVFQFMFDLMKERFPEKEAAGYLNVKNNNKPALIFYMNHLQSELVAPLIFTRYFFWRRLCKQKAA